MMMKSLLILSLTVLSLLPITTCAQASWGWELHFRLYDEQMQLMDWDDWKKRKLKLNSDSGNYLEELSYDDSSKSFIVEMHSVIGSCEFTLFNQSDTLTFMTPSYSLELDYIRLWNSFRWRRRGRW